MPRAYARAIERRRAIFILPATPNERTNSSQLSEARLTIAIIADTQGVDDMNDNDEWVGYSHWGMFPLG